MIMELKPHVCVHSDIFERTDREFWDRAAFQKYMPELFSSAYLATMDKPLIKLTTRLVGEIDGHKIRSVESEHGLEIFVSEDYNIKYGCPCTTNRRTGRPIILSPRIVIVNSVGRQIYPPLSGRKKSELDKFTKNAFQTIYRVEKTK